MGTPSKEEVKSFILEFLGNNSTYGKDAASMVTDDIDLFTSGLISSMGFIELISALEKQFSMEFDFENTDPAEYSTVGSIIRYVVKGTGHV